MKRIIGSVLTLVALSAVGFGYFFSPNLQLAQAQITTVDENQALLQNELNTIEVIETYGPSVVAVNVEVSGQMVNPFGNQDFFDQIPEQFRDLIPEPDAPEGDLEEFQQQGSGSGFVVSDDGDIITNYHVVASALEPQSVTPREGTRLSVVFPTSDEQLTVTVIGVNEFYDLALLKLENSENMPEVVRAVVPIPISNSDEVRVGQKVIAIGNPFGFASTVTTGIVSGLSRSLPGVGTTDIPLIQTDAAINPGNSGGPLLNSKGELIGINTAIIPGQGGGFGNRGNIGIGFAVPSNLLQRNLADLRDGGFTNIQARPRIGIGIADVEVYPDSVRESFNFPEDGVVVREVEPGGPAEVAGLRGGDFDVEIDGETVMVAPDTPLRAGGDIIVSADGEAVTNTGDLVDLVLSKDAGDTVELVVIRDGEEQNITVTLAVVPQNEEQASAAPDTEPEAAASESASLGVSVQDVSSYPEKIRESLNLPAEGAIVTEVSSGSAAEAAGVRGGQFALEDGGERYAAGGDVILAVDGEAVADAQSLAGIISSRSAGDDVELRVWRNGEEQTLSATLGTISN